MDTSIHGSPSGVNRVVVLGGGTGISNVLRGLVSTAETHPLELTAVVATGDDGGSSGRLREQRGGLPPGDLRACLLALSREDGHPFRRIFAHRYEGEGDLAGHALGNLILSALAEEEGGYLQALEVAACLLGAHGRVYPVTLEPIHLYGEGPTGERLLGESEIGRTESIRRVWIEPAGVGPTPGVEAAIQLADLLVLGPGSLFTSLLPVLLVPGIARAVRKSRGRRVLVSNLMTQPGETLGMDLAAHMEALDRHAGPGLLDTVLVHRGEIAQMRLAPYAEERSEPVQPERLGGRPEHFLFAPLATREGKIRHEPGLLATALLGLLDRAAAGRVPEAAS